MSANRTCHSDPRNIHTHAHAMLVEQVMAMHGRGSSDPRTYRRILERMDAPALRRALEGTDFPALEETADDITHAIPASGASTPARDLLSAPQPSTVELSTSPQ